MKIRALSRSVLAIFSLAAITLSLAVRIQAQTFRVLHSFTGGGDGAEPGGDVLFDSAGNIYGTTLAGGNPNTCTGSQGCGVVYKLSRGSSGGWRATSLFQFISRATGTEPLGNLVMDASGNLLGAALAGGNSATCGGGCGLIYELTPTSSAPWQETVAQVFNDGPEGAFPRDGLVADGAGNFYGIAGNGGNTGCGGIGCGVVYELSPSASGGWQQQVIYTFSGGADGAFPSGRLIFDKSGNLYGAASGGGHLDLCSSEGCGVVYELSPSSSGTWTETVLHTFARNGDGAQPIGGLAFDGPGNLYGVTYMGGVPSTCGGNGCGVLYKLAPTGGGWTFSAIHDFQGGSDGGNSSSGVVLDPTGGVYGVTNIGGLSTCGCGVVFKFNANSRGQWQETLLHLFTGGADGARPIAPLAFGPDGNLYGTAVQGGTSNAGVVFKVTP